MIFDRPGNQIVNISGDNVADMPRVLVILASYNGQKWIKDQLDSILNQNGVSVTVHVYDDKSADDTYGILASYYESSKQVLVFQNEKSLGAALNFMQGIWNPRSAGFDYYAFSDQDDYWLPDKLTHAINCIESTSPHTKGCLYYSDYTNVDENLTNPRREKYVYANCIYSALAPLLKNWAPGCTMVFDCKMRDLLALRPQQSLVRLHDVWVYLVARYCADIYSDLSESYILRRITHDNVVGEESAKFRSIGDALASVKRFFSHPKHEIQHTAIALLDAYGDKMHQKDSQLLHKVGTYRRKLSTRIELAFSKDLKAPYRSTELLQRFKFIIGRW